MDLNAFIDRARELGIVITGEEAAKADALGDAWDDLKPVFSAITFQTGAALSAQNPAIDRRRVRRPLSAGRPQTERAHP